MSLCSAFRSQCFSTKVAASQSSKLGMCRQLALGAEIFFGQTRPAAEMLRQARFTATRAVRGFLGSSIHLARPRRLRGRPWGERKNLFRRSGSPVRRARCKRPVSEGKSAPLRQFLHHHDFGHIVDDWFSSSRSSGARLAGRGTSVHRAK